jgi:hypothetical protein
MVAFGSSGVDAPLRFDYISIDGWASQLVLSSKTERRRASVQTLVLDAGCWARPLGKRLLRI